MPPSLTGLNIVQSPPNNYESQDLLPPYPDISSQLELWTNLRFESDDGPLLSRPRAEDDDGAVPAHNPAQFDLQSFMSGFPMGPAPPNTGLSAPSLAQILSLHNAQNPTQPASHKIDTSVEPAAKRVRTRKVSVSNGADSSYEADSPTDTPLSAAEDKRRRNTAASARFRLKKKEREAALETKAKELETRVNELERECEGLRRENGWLKGLVVGVTGAAQNVNNAIPSAPPSLASLKRPRDDE